MSDLKPYYFRIFNSYKYSHVFQYLPYDYAIYIYSQKASGNFNLIILFKLLDIGTEIKKTRMKRIKKER